MTDHLAPVAVLAPSSRQLTRWCGTRRNHYPNLVCIDTLPTVHTTVAMVADAILDSLGKDPLLTTAKSSAEQLAVAWLSLGEIDQALIVDGQLLPVRTLIETIQLLAAVGVRCWVLIRTEPDGSVPADVQSHLELIADLGASTASEADLAAAFPNTKRTVPRPKPSLPRLPRVDGLMFRSACRDLLSPENFAAVDAQFVTAVREFRTEFAAITGATKTRTLARLLKRHLASTEDTESFVLQVRAAQVAAVTCGFHVAVHTGVLLGAELALPRIGVSEERQWWRLLDAYRDPSFGAIAALYTHNIDPESVPQLTLAAIGAPEPDGTVRVTWRKDTVTVGAEAGRFLTAQVTYRRLCGADDDSRVFASHRADFTQFRYITRQLDSLPGDVGIEVASTPIRRQHPDAIDWLKAYGIRIEKLQHTPRAERAAS